VIRGLRGVAADWQDHNIANLGMVAAAGDWVVVGYTWRVRGGRERNREPTGRASAYRISDGRIIEIRFCWNGQEALEAAGLTD
jgi:hypothetical protein